MQNITMNNHFFFIRTIVHESRIIWRLGIPQKWNKGEPSRTLFALNNVALMNFPKLDEKKRSWSEFKSKLILFFLSNKKSLKKQESWHQHYAWEQFHKLDFVTFYLNETFESFLTEKKWN